MNTTLRGLRMARSYALILGIALFAANCFNSVPVPEPQQPQVLVYDVNGNLISAPDTSKTKAKNPDNIKIVLRTTLGDDDHRDGHHDRSFAADRHERKGHEGRDGKDHEFDEIDDVHDVYLTFSRVEVLNALGEWLPVETADARDREVKFPYQVNTEVTLESAYAPAGEYTHIKLILGDGQYVILAGDQTMVTPLYLDEDDHEHRHGQKDMEEGSDQERRLRVKRFEPVMVQEGMLTTIYIDVNLNNFVDYKERHEKYFLNPEVRFGGTTATPIPVEQPVKDAAVTQTKTTKTKAL